MALGKIGTNQIDTAATPTVASATVTGDLTVDTNTLYVDSANNRVGINTTTPNEALTIEAPLSSDTGLAINYSGDNKAGITVNPSTGQIKIGVHPDLTSGSGYYLSFNTATSNTVYERMRIDSSGKVGIGPGATTPAANLHISGSGQQSLTIGSTDASRAILVLDGDSNGDGAGSDYAYVAHETDGSLSIANLKTGVMNFNGIGAATKLSLEQSEIRFHSSTSYFDASISDQGQLIGAIGAYTTTGTTDWNHSTNARSGNGHTLLLGSATNGPGGSSYYHSFCFEYHYKDATGNLAQWAIGYNTNARYMRYRYQGTWSSWVSF